MLKREIRVCNFFSGGIEKVNHSCIGLYVEAVNCSKDAGKKACFVKIKEK